jgi:hypothetical protein
MGKACGTCAGRRKCSRDLVRKSEAKKTVECVALRGRIILKLTLNEEGWKSVDWINLAQDKDKCQSVVNTVMNLRAP